MKRRDMLIGTMAALATPGIATAQAWPARPLRMVIPWPPGGTTDILARIIQPPLSVALGQTVVIENRGGASGAIGTAELLRAAPDGYSFGIVTSTLVSAPLLSRQPFHPVNDVTPILHLADVANILAVHPSLPVHSVRELIDYGKANPGKLSFASPGIGSAVHISGEMFKLMTGVDMVHVPYRGGGPAIAALVSGEIQLMFGNGSSTLPHVRTGAVRALGVTSAQRQPYLPEVPTIAEAALPGFDIVEWYAVIGPAGMPDPVVDRLNREFMAIVGTPEGRARLLDLGSLVVGGTPAQMGALLRGDMEKIGRVVREARITAE
ncbi:tripartite tricarboxylate transporter substrate binding protein [Roseomonas sp. JC162]|uniref:Tripartite tricarboxylate transporter substrate binding protein n=1 Tax=Neoroseomonas marina TaxID=1232220 RepID=A0A848EH99_9PROT|nr:tripartite tricarboxylate transporter substrate binding protein [Neoroseomonas marina]NMJ43356.1 tripartite tricarboxylate transporter substrate binding protein [Neoroseomonas marina]